MLAALEANQVSSAGPFIPRFESAFARFCGVKHAIATSNGTTALHLALLALGIGPGDEVIVPALTFAASANAVIHAGAKPVFVDVDPHNWGLDLRDAGRQLTKRSRAIMPVHLYGHPDDMTAVGRFAREHGLAVLEDAAEAHGARWRDREVGSWGDAAAFSFYGNKILTTGEGGMITTNDAAVADRARLLRNHGMDPRRRYWHPVVGYNYRLTNLQAALGLAQVQRARGLMAAKRRIAARYRRRLAGLPLMVRDEHPSARSADWMVCVVMDKGSPITRDQVMAALGRDGIETRPFFYPLPQMPPYQDGREYAVAADLSARGLNLPCGAGLTAAEVDRVCRRLKDLFR